MSIEKSADTLEIASQRTEQYNEQARLQRDAEERQRIETYDRMKDEGLIDGTSCYSCGEDLPEERIQDKRLRCTPCQTALEYRNRQGRGN